MWSNFGASLTFEKVLATDDSWDDDNDDDERRWLVKSMCYRV